MAKVAQKRPTAAAPARGQEVANTTKAPDLGGEVVTKPDYLAQMEAQGRVKLQDNFDSTDVAVPRVKLLQGLSKECENFPDAKAGRFWHTGMDLNLGDEIKFVVCSRRKKFLLVAPLEDGQGILARADDAVTWNTVGKWDVKLKGKKTPVTWEITDRDVAKSGLDKWGTYDPTDENSPPAATLFYDYLVLVLGHLELGPAVISIARSGVRQAKKGLNDKIALHAGNGRPMQSIVFSAKAVADTNSENQEFKNWLFQGSGFATEDLYKYAMEISGMMTEFKVQDEEGATREEAGRPTGATDSDKY